MAYQNSWYSAKCKAQKENIALSAYIRKKEKPQINDLKFNLKKLGKREKLNQASRI